MALLAVWAGIGSVGCSGHASRTGADGGAGDAGPSSFDGGLVVTTLAGNGRLDLDGTAGPDGTAEIDQPTGVATDTRGNVFVADSDNRIRKIDSTGAVTTLAGGRAGYADGSGGPTGTAQFYQPAGIAVDAAGNVYVADTGNNCIRRIDPTGNVTTLAGGMQGFADGTGGNGGTAEFNAPSSVAVDGQVIVYVADFGNARVRRIDAMGNVTTLAGNGAQGYRDGTGGPDGSAEFAYPSGVAVDAQKKVYVADELNDRIRVIDTAGNVTTLAGNGTAGYFDGSGGPTGTGAHN